MASSGMVRMLHKPHTVAAPISTKTANRLRPENSMMRLITAALPPRRPV